MTRDEARILISSLIEWYTEDLGERLGLNMCAETYMDALEVLWHGPEGDLIRRADAIEAVDRWKDYDGDICWREAIDKAKDALSALPSAEAVQGWIPCSERLPKRDELVLVTYKTTDRIHLCKYFDDGSENQWWSYIDDCCVWNNVVLAWMPLPTPYKGGDDK